ncbi:hypothetical protein LCGC14_2072260 [marine sediment metagenome]|uniref:SF4 helicase domain-containing protein n=1 Tax=marine sediment metagenome TaxID=412755 RepID=A0A0F9HF22_9ZZZZ
METFNEKAFIFALSSRPEDAKRFAVTFKPSWLNNTEFVPILAELYAFTRKHGEPPSISTLHTVFKDKDAEAYSLRYKAALETIANDKPDLSSIIYTLSQARDTGIVRDFQELASDQTFLKKQSDLKGNELMTSLNHFFNRHGDLSEDKTLNIQEAIEYLVANHGFSPELTRIPTGIEVIDDWSGGGLKAKQLGIIMAPTGEGKSSLLVVMAHKMAANELKRVWVVTNELSMEEQTERMLARITGKAMTDIINDPGVAFEGLDREWKAGLHNRLRLTEVNREVSVDELEAEMCKWVNLIGWKPDVLILDFMERMKPNDKGFSRDRVWDWLGAIARDLSRFAKRNNILIWTAAQTNRSGLRKGADMSLDMAQSSIKHLQEATVVIGMKQNEIGDDKVVMEFTSLKQRHSRRSARPVSVECDLGRMSITNDVWNPESSDDDVVAQEKQDEKDRKKKASKNKKKEDLLTPEDARKKRLGQS